MVVVLITGCFAIGWILQLDRIIFCCLLDLVGVLLSAASIRGVGDLGDVIDRGVVIVAAPLVVLRPLVRLRSSSSFAYGFLHIAKKP